MPVVSIFVFISHLVFSLFVDHSQFSIVCQRQPILLYPCSPLFCDARTWVSELILLHQCSPLSCDIRIRVSRDFCQNTKTLVKTLFFSAVSFTLCLSMESMQLQSPTFLRWMVTHFPKISPSWIPLTDFLSMESLTSSQKVQPLTRAYNLRVHGLRRKGRLMAHCIFLCGLSELGGRLRSFPSPG